MATLTDTPIKKKKSTMRKSPNAPKRFRSSYILFYAHVQVKIKAELGEKASGPDVSKRASMLWKNLSPEERQHWDNEAVKERERYATEKAAFTGPWQVPHKRVKKDPAAPKRNPSAFLLFAQGKRQELKKLNPAMKNTEISRILGKMWRDTPLEKKRSFIEREAEEREKYKNDMVEWKKKQETDKIESAKDSFVTDIRDRWSDENNSYSYPSYVPNAREINYYHTHLCPPHTFMHRPRMNIHGQQNLHPHYYHQHLSLQRPLQKSMNFVSNTNIVNMNTQDVHTSEYLHQHYIHPRPQLDRNNHISDYKFVQDNYGPFCVESRDQQEEEGRYINNFPNQDDDGYNTEYSSNQEYRGAQAQTYYHVQYPQHTL